MLVGYTASDVRDLALTAALAAPAFVAVVVDAALRRVRGRRGAAARSRRG